MKDQIVKSSGKWAGLVVATLCAAALGNHIIGANLSADAYLYPTAVQSTIQGAVSPVSDPLPSGAQLRVTETSATRTSATQVRMAFSHALPSMDGAHLNVKVVEVTYAPGESSAAHSHPCPVIGYVLEGAVRMQVKGEAEATYKAGDTFYEAPNGVHAVSANASRDAPARFLAYFVCDHDTPLTVAPPKANSGGGK
jgi:quercetin dioxygenase-like cupin family protein